MSEKYKASQNITSNETSVRTIDEWVNELPVKAEELKKKFVAGAVPQERDFKVLIEAIYTALAAVGLDPDRASTGNGLKVDKMTNKLEVDTNSIQEKLTTDNNTGIDISSDNQISINTSKIQEKLTAVSNTGIDISSDNQISINTSKIQEKLTAVNNTGIDISSNNQISIDTKIIQKKLKSGNGINISDKNDTVSIKNNRLTGIMVLATLHGATHYSYYFGFFTLYTKVTSGIWRVYISTHMLESINNSTPPELLEYYDNKIISIDGENLNTNQYKSNGRMSMFLDIHISDTTDDISKKKLHIKINNNNQKIPIHKIIWD